MGFIGRQPTAAPLTSSDITDGIISTAKLANDAVDNTKLDLSDNYAFTGTITGAGGTFKQITTGEHSTQVVSNSQALTNTGLSGTITPSSSSSKILLLINQRLDMYAGANQQDLRFSWRVRRNIGGTLTTIRNSNSDGDSGTHLGPHSSDNIYRGYSTYIMFDSPSTTSAITYETLMIEQGSNSSITANYQYGYDARSSIIMLEY